MEEVRTGGCLCGAVRFRTRGALRGVVYCHCSQCRKQTGHVYAATSLDDTRLEIDGAEMLTWYAASDDAKRGFCRTCGSALFWKRNGTDVATATVILKLILMPRLCFDMPSGLKGETHIFVAEKADYYEIEDGLPQYARSSASVPVKENATKAGEGQS